MELFAVPGPHARPDFKSRFYVHEGFEESTGRPTRAGLETLGLGFAADALEAAGKLGS